MNTFLNKSLNLIFLIAVIWLSFAPAFARADDVTFLADEGQLVAVMFLTLFNGCVQMWLWFPFGPTRKPKEYESCAS